MVGAEAQRAFIEQKDETLDQASVYAFTIPVFGKGIIYEGEQIIRFGQLSDADACRVIKKYMASEYTDEDRFYLSRAFDRLYKTDAPLMSLEAAKAHLEKKSGKAC